MSNNNEVTLRLSTKGKEKLIQDLKEMGGEHARLAKQIEAGTSKANAGIRGVNAASKEGKGALEGMANQGGLAGRILKDLGPAGLAAGAGIGVAVAAFSAAVRIGREAVTAFAQVGRSAENLQLSTSHYQALKAAAAETGVEFGKVEGAMANLSKAHSDLMLGQGELVARLKETNPELLEQLRLTTSNDERLRLIQESLRGATSETEKANIAYAAFGGTGLEVVRMLEAQEGSLDDMIRKYSDMGLIVREEVIKNSEEMERRFGMAAQVVDLQLKQAFVDLAPVILESVELMADLSRWLNDLLSLTKQFSDRTDRQLESRATDILGRLKKQGISEDEIKKALALGEKIQMPGQVASHTGAGFSEGAMAQQFAANQKEIQWNSDWAELEKIYAERGKRAEQAFQDAAAETRRRASREELEERKAALEQALAQTEAFRAEAMRERDGDRVNDFQNSAIEIKTELDRVNAELQRRASLPTGKSLGGEDGDKARQAELNRLRTEAIQLQKKLGDTTLYLAEQTARYGKLRDEGLITEEQYTRAVQVLTDELSGAKAAMDLWKGLLDAARSPVEILTDKMDLLDKDYSEGRINIDLYREAMERLRTELEAASETERTSAPGYAEAEAIRQELERAASDALSPAQKLIEEQKRINELVQSGQLEGDQATAWLELYEKRLNEAAGKVGLLATAEQLLDGVQKGRIRTWGDLKQAFGDMLIDMVRKYLMAQQQMGGGGDFLSSLFGAGKSALQNFNFGGWNIGQSHSGGSGRNPPQIRSASSGPLSHEKLVMVDDSQTILTQAGRMDIAAQISAMAAERHQLVGLVSRAAQASAPAGIGGLKVIINNHAGAEVETSMREGPEGPEMTVDIKGAMREMVSGGVIDGPMQDRYGILPKN